MARFSLLCLVARGLAISEGLPSNASTCPGSAVLRGSSLVQRRAWTANEGSRQLHTDGRVQTEAEATAPQLADGTAQELLATKAPQSPPAPSVPSRSAPSLASHVPALPVSSEKLAVTMDWPLNGLDFSLSNYRALDAVLGVHPNAEVQVDIFAPAYAAWYRHGNSISFRYFEKYEKRGYDAKVNRIGDDTLPRRNWENNATAFRHSLRNAMSNYSEDVRLPGPALLWLRLARLHQRGGIFLDFTTLLLRPVVEQRGFAVAPPECQIVGGPRLPPMVLAFPAMDPVLECALAEIEAACTSQGESLICNPEVDAARLLSGCHVNFPGLGENTLNDSVAWNCPAAEVLDRPVEEASLPESWLAVWLGPRAMDGEWRRGHEGSLAVALEERAKLSLTRYAHSSQDIHGEGGRCRTLCHNYAAVPLGSQRRGSPSETRASAENCAPQVIVPGTRKGASSFIFHFLAQHPQFVHPVDGAGFKETRAYLDMYDRGRRITFFPHIEPDENFVTGDGSVDLMMEENAPRRIKADASNAKAIFILREPADRAYSDYKFIYNWFQKRNMSFDAAMRGAQQQLNECFTTSEGDRLQGKAAMNSFWRCQDGEADIAKRGLYVYQVLHWINVLGRESVMVLTFEETVHHPNETIARVVDFLGLCPYEFAPRGKENYRKIDVEPQDAATPEGMREYSAFFEPYNRLLYSAIGKDLGWEAHVASRG